MLVALRLYDTLENIEKNKKSRISNLLGKTKDIYKQDFEDISYDEEFIGMGINKKEFFFNEIVQ
uniref:hypothetical protein n=1 Tax=Aliarcobacter sp. TaxID=2321116 RepID=UPI004048E098